MFHIGDRLSHVSVKNGNEWNDNKENTANYSGSDLKRRKLDESTTSIWMDVQLDTYIPPYAKQIDSYVPKYKNRMEWLQEIKEREKKQRAGMVQNHQEEERSFIGDSMNEVTPKSGSETISDEHNASFNSIFAGKASSLVLDEVSQDNIVWPSWLDPTGKLSANIAPPPEFQPFIQNRKKQRLKQREEIQAHLGDPLSPVNVTTLKSAKGVLSGDGWKRQKDGERLPNIFWKFLSGETQPVDPRGQDYLANIM